MHYWLGGNQPRLPAELARSIDQIAQLWGATLATSTTGLLAGHQAGRNSLPRLKEVLGRDKKLCKTLHPDFLVVRDLGEYVWLAIDTKAESQKNQFFIEPRCGFDY